MTQIQEAAREAFEELDDNKDGTLDLEEFKKGLKDDFNLTDMKKVDKLFKRTDINKNKVIEKEEWIKNCLNAYKY